MKKLILSLMLSITLPVLSAGPDAEFKEMETALKKSSFVSDSKKWSMLSAKNSFQGVDKVIEEWKELTDAIKPKMSEGVQEELKDIVVATNVLVNALNTIKKMPNNATPSKVRDLLQMTADAGKKMKGSLFTRFKRVVARPAEKVIITLMRNAVDKRIKEVINSYNSAVNDAKKTDPKAKKISY